jgi:small subunit ribosomal protein S9
MAIKKTDEILATGRRKCAVARVRMTEGTGKLIVNGMAAEEYFASDALCGYIAQVFKTADVEGKFDVRANLDGGGKAGQAGALRHGLARALVKLDESYRAVLKAAGMMTRDARVKERKKSGQPGARRRFQFSKR